DYCDQILQDLNPRIEQFEQDMRSEFQRFRKFLPEFPCLLSKPFIAMQGQLSGPSTSIQVGKTFLKVNSSFQNSQKFLQNLFEHELKKAQENTNDSHKRLAGMLFQTMQIVDEACCITQLIEELGNAIRHFRNKLSL